MDLSLVIYGSQKVGEIWTLKTVTLTKTMTRVCPSSHGDYQTIRFRPGVDSQISHGSDMETDYFKISEFTQKHSPLFMFQVVNLTLKRLYISVNRRNCMHFVFCVSHRDGAFDTQQKI